jgi:2-polyprenyl-3-methyl-5-hydroxy-6-metoxy-1,4-benzoquinol methylase
VLGIELARLGHTVHGIDISPEMVHMVREKSKGLQGISFDVADMTDYRADGEFDLVLHLLKRTELSRTQKGESSV